MFAIGTVSSARDEVLDDDWGDVDAVITLLPPFDERSVQGLDEFSHLEVVFLFDRVDPETVHTGARWPHGNPAWPEVGIFAQRAKDRPNRIGLSSCELVAVEGHRPRPRPRRHRRHPVLDIKPYMEEFGPAPRAPTSVVPRAHVRLLLRTPDKGLRNGTSALPIAAIRAVTPDSQAVAANSSCSPACEREVAGHELARAAIVARICGSSSAQRSCAFGQRVRKRQPLGGSIGDGISPPSTVRRRRAARSGSGTGIAASSAAVYGCAGRA